MSAHSDNDVREHWHDNRMTEPTYSPIVRVAGRAIAPFILLIGLYVFFHGHYSPGGGFQGGVLMAAGIFLLRLSLGVRLSQDVMPARYALRLGALGALIFVGTGFLAVLMGGDFLDYHYLPAPSLTPEYLRYYGMLLVEVGVTLTVMTALVAIFDNLLGY